MLDIVNIWYLSITAHSNKQKIPDSINNNTPNVGVNFFWKSVQCRKFLKKAIFQQWTTI